jgi:hypothetical protein
MWKEAVLTQFELVSYPAFAWRGLKMNNLEDDSHLE